MRILLFLSVLLCTFSLRAQKNVNGEWKKQVSATFANLNIAEAPGGILLDYAMEFTDVSRYNGTINDSSLVDAAVFSKIYKTLLMGRTTSDTVDFPRPENYASSWFSKRFSYNNGKQGTLVLGGLFYRYGQIDSLALKDNRINVVDNKYYDVYVDNEWQNPFSEKYTMAIAPPVLVYNKLKFEIVLPQDLFMNNVSGEIGQIEADFDDGEGWQSLQFDESKTVTYPAEGNYKLRFRIGLKSGQIFESGTVLTISDVISAASAYENNVHIAGPPSRPGAVLRIDYAPLHNGRLMKPLIVAEGFDTGAILTPEIEGGDRTLENFRLDIDETFEGGNLTNLLTGNARQYDIVYVDWENGTQSLQQNSVALQNVIEWVNAKKAQAGSTEPNVLWGQSMGGVIGRYTLAKMEKDGLNHDTRLFIAHDSPMQGSNTPISIQHFTRHMYDEYVSAPGLYANNEIILPTIIDFVNWISNAFNGNPVTLFDDIFGIGNVLTLQDTPAAMQMNYYYVNFDGNATTQYHDAWQDELEQMGYPQQCRNIAISNGNECAEDQGYGPRSNLIALHTGASPTFLQNLIYFIATPAIADHIGDIQLQLLSHLPGSSKYKTDFEMRANPEPYASAREVYYGRIRYEKKLLWLVTITHTLTERSKNAPTGYLPMETYSGGYYDILGSGLQQFVSYLPSNTVVNRYFGFIPVVSALDVKRYGSEPAPADYKKRYAGGTMPETALSTPFNNFIVDFTNGINRPHISIQPRIGNWLARELNENPLMAGDCSFVCDATAISGPGVVCTSGAFQVPEGFSFASWSISPSNAGSVASGQGTNTAVFNFSSSYNSWATITVTLTSPCGNVTLQKQVWRGLPKTPTAISGPGNVLVASMVGYTTNSWGATSYVWTGFSPVSSFNYYGPGWQVLSGQNTGSGVSVFTGTAGYPATITVKGCNVCGCSPTISRSVVSGGPGAIGMSPTTGENPNSYFKIYPNPASDVTYIDLVDQNNAPKTGASINAELYDFYGASRGNINIINNGATIDVSSLGKGIYTLVISVDGDVEAHQLAVN